MDPQRRPGTFTPIKPSTPPLQQNPKHQQQPHGATAEFYPPPPPVLGNVRQRSSSAESSGDASPQRRHLQQPYPRHQSYFPQTGAIGAAGGGGAGGAGGAHASSSDTIGAMANKRSQFPPRMPGSSTPTQGGLTPGGGGGGGSVAGSPGTSHNFSRPSIAQVVIDTPQRKNSPLNPGQINDPRSHKRNNSQGFFEPSLPTASLTSAGPEHGSRGELSPSYIAAQAAMQQQQQQQQQAQQQAQQQQQQQMPSEGQMVRKRSQTVPSPLDFGTSVGRGRPPALQTTQSAIDQRTGLPLAQYPQQSLNSPTSAALAASNVAFPRGTTQMSPGLTNFADLDRETGGKEARSKEKGERSKMKLFSKPRNIGISSHRDQKEKERPPPSPGKAPSIYSRNGFNASTTSLGEITAPPSLYSMGNSSTNTLVPSDKHREEKGHRHHLFGRQKKYKDKPEDHALTPSSAAGHTKTTEISSAHSIYSLGPPSPGLPQGAFKSVSGLDLRHGGRALREKKHLASEPRRGDETPGTFGLAPLNTPSFGLPSEFSQGPLQGFGTSNIAPDDAWSFLRAKLLTVFGGEEVRIPIEDLNHLVSIYIQRCVKTREPTTIAEDLSDLFTSGFLSLDQTLRGVPEGQLVRALVDMWLFVFGVVLPYMQAVFLPLDLEFAGHGPIMTSADAAEFWGRELRADVGPEAELGVRKLVLLAYRDTVILPRHDALKALFSRLSLESIQMVTMDGMPAPPLPPFSPAGGNRPGTAGSLGPSSAYGSYTSQGSTLRSSSSGGDGSGARSRATSNTSAPELPPFSPTSAGRNPAQREQVQQMHSQVITETVGRMLQCLSVLSSLRSEDEAQRRCEALTTALKLNWLGRGRTGRNRKGFVGARVPMRPGGVRVGG